MIVMIISIIMMMVTMIIRCVNYGVNDGDFDYNNDDNDDDGDDDDDNGVWLFYYTGFINKYIPECMILLYPNVCLFVLCHGGPIELFHVQPLLHDWCNKGRGMCHPVCRMMHIK